MTMNDKSHLALKQFFSELTKPDCTTLLIAAAGNHGTPQRFWPAAYAKDAPSAVVSVGALRSDGTSFATPLVAGIIASYMSTHKTGAREAAQAVLRQAEAITDHGITLR